MATAFPTPYPPTANNDLRSGLGIPPTAKVILYVGRNRGGKSKGHMSIRRVSFLDVQLVIAGSVYVMHVGATGRVDQGPAGHERRFTGSTWTRSLVDASCWAWRMSADVP